MVDYTRLVAVPKGINDGIRPLNNRFMLAQFGAPRPVATVDCAPVRNEKLRAAMVTRNVGPFRVTGHSLAVADLEKIYAVVKAEHPELYAILGTAGMLCARRVRGGQSWSNHSFGFAIDHTIGGKLDPRGDGRTQYGMAVLGEIFNEHGWFWGAGFGIEDAMHMEMGLDRLAGLLGKRNGVPAKDDVLEVGDRGPEVMALQKKIGAKPADGIFGPGTKAALATWQASRGLKPDGIAGPKTKAALGL